MMAKTNNDTVINSIIKYLKLGEYWRTTTKQSNIDKNLVPICSFIKGLSTREEILQATRSIYWHLIIAKGYGTSIYNNDDQKSGKNDLCLITKDIAKKIVDVLRVVIRSSNFNIKPNEINQYDNNDNIDGLLDDLLAYYLQDSDNLLIKCSPEIYSYRPDIQAEGKKNWQDNLNQNIMAIDEPFGDLTQLSKAEIETKIKSDKPKCKVWEYSNPIELLVKNINIGDIIIARQGKDKILGYGIVESDYYYDENVLNYKHRRKVKWVKKYFDCNNTNIGYMLAGSGTPKIKSVGLRSLYSMLADKLDIAECKQAIKEWDTNYQKHSSSVNEVRDKMNNFDKNLILCGPPGTGKTYNLANYAVAIIENKSLDEVSKQRTREELIDRYNELQQEGRIQFVTFHQSYGYEEFIEGLRPKLVEAKSENASETEKSGDVKYEIHSGVFKAFCDQILEDNEKSAQTSGDSTTSKNPPETEDSSAISADESKENGAEVQSNLLEPSSEKNYVFIIDEINRGNISKIFGELITLIEDSRRKGAKDETSAKLPQSNDEFTVPGNLYIIGTMNTADRSITQIDTALRRRFSFCEMMPNSSTLEKCMSDIDIPEMLDSINKRIEFLYDREHQIGHAYFIKLKDIPESEKMAALGKIFEYKIIPLLQEYFFEDYEKIRLVLGDTGKNYDDQFIQKEVKSGRNGLFSIGNNQDIDLDIDEKSIYRINSGAFLKKEAYIGIYASSAANGSGEDNDADSAQIPSEPNLNE